MGTSSDTNSSKLAEKKLKKRRQLDALMDKYYNGRKRQQSNNDQHPLIHHQVKDVNTTSVDINNDELSSSSAASFSPSNRIRMKHLEVKRKRPHFYLAVFVDTCRQLCLTLFACFLVFVLGGVVISIQIQVRGNLKVINEQLEKGGKDLIIVFEIFQYILMFDFTFQLKMSETN